MKKIVIGVTTRCILNDIGLYIDKVPSGILKYIQKLGAIALIIPSDLDNIDYYLEKCDGFIIPGGDTWTKMDESIINYAVLNDVPLMGICAGMQAIGNIHNFGLVKSDQSVLIESKEIEHRTLVQNAHEINILDGSLKNILNKDRIWVNSRHENCVVKSDCFIIEAVSDDGVIEAISLPNKRFIVGFEWHPEDLDNSDSFKIFEYFVCQCGR